MRLTYQQRLERIVDERKQVENEIGRLANWILRYAPQEIEGSAVDTAIKIMEKAIGVGLDSSQERV